MTKSAERMTITELARRAGLHSRTIRFWSDAGLIPVAARSATGYRLYDATALARLSLVRTLRELGLGIAAITQILEQQQTVAQAATTHIAAIDAQLRSLRLQRAILQVVVRRAAGPKETQHMHQLLTTSAAERKRIVNAFVERAFADIPQNAPGAAIAHAMRSLPPELPDEPSDAHVEAWLELLGLLTDASFAARVREMAVAGAAAALPQPIDMGAVREHAGRALAAGIDPLSGAADGIVSRILPPLTAAERSQLRQRLEAFNDVCVERYWQLMGVLYGRPPFPPVAVACAWLIEALRARDAPAHVQ